MPPRMECDFTTWVTNCSPAGGFLIVRAPFLLGTTPSSSPLRPSRGNRFCRHFTWEGGRATIHPFPGILLALRPPSAVLYRTPGWKDTTTRAVICELDTSSLLSLPTGEQYVVLSL